MFHITCFTDFVVNWLPLICCCTYNKTFQEKVMISLVYTFMLSKVGATARAFAQWRHCIALLQTLGCRGSGRPILTPLYNIYHLENYTIVRRSVIIESSPLHIVSAWNRFRSPCSPSVIPNH